MYIHTYRQTNKGENVSDTRKHSSRVRTCEYLWPPLDVSTWGRVYLLRPPPLNGQNDTRPQIYTVVSGN